MRLCLVESCAVLIVLESADQELMIRCAVRLSPSKDSDDKDPAATPCRYPTGHPVLGARAAWTCSLLSWRLRCSEWITGSGHSCCSHYSQLVCRSRSLECPTKYKLPLGDTELTYSIELVLAAQQGLQLEEREASVSPPCLSICRS